jgi:hypothetical protein
MSQQSEGRSEANAKTKKRKHKGKSERGERELMRVEEHAETFPSPFAKTRSCTRSIEPNRLRQNSADFLPAHFLEGPYSPFRTSLVLLPLRLRFHSVHLIDLFFI